MQHSLGDSLDPSGQGAYAHPMLSIRILNPRRNSSNHTSPQSAARLVKRNQATWIDPFTISIIRRGPDPLSALGYDRVDRPFERFELRALPVNGNLDLVFNLGGSRNAWGWDVATDRRTRAWVAS